MPALPRGHPDLGGGSLWSVDVQGDGGAAGDAAGYTFERQGMR